MLECIEDSPWSKVLRVKGNVRPLGYILGGLSPRAIHLHGIRFLSPLSLGLGDRIFGLGDLLDSSLLPLLRGLGL